MDYAFIETILVEKYGLQTTILGQKCISMLLGWVFNDFPKVA